MTPGPACDEIPIWVWSSVALQDLTPCPRSPEKDGKQTGIKQTKQFDLEDQTLTAHGEDLILANTTRTLNV